ncbi:MAG: ATP--guanido phosphotransferase [Clostridia bacterium]|nr:ATP--guanido phosphotransferase [Clostridia bacterium]
MKWYENTGRDHDVIVSSRVRLARNLVDYPFGNRLDDTSKKEIIAKVKDALCDGKKYTFRDFASLSETERIAAAEEHTVSPEFARGTGPRALIESADGSSFVMVLEEDHVRIQTITPGFSLDEAFDKAREIDQKLDSKLNIAYDEKLGYLTHCPTNLGTGMRASVMMFLPGTARSGSVRNLSNQLGKIGLTIRGMAGEGSSADGCLFQISNQVTLGVSEEETIAKLTKITERLIEQERALRKKMFEQDPDALTDRVMRAYGTMLYAALIDTEELFRLYSDVRLGVSLGVIDCVTAEQLDRILIGCMPAVLMRDNENVRDARSRDKARAETVRRLLSGPEGKN